MINYAINNYKLHILVILFLLLSLPAFPQSVASGFPALNITDQGNGETTYSLSLQILALMTSLEFNFCISSKIYRKNKRDFMWCSEFKNKKNKKFIIKLIINSKHTNFNILYLLKKNKKDLTKTLYKNKFPFKKKYKNDDYRVDAIRKYINNSIRLKNRKLIYFKILSLWNKVNKKTKLIKL